MAPPSSVDSPGVEIWVAEKKLGWKGTVEFEKGKGDITTVKIKPDEGAVYLGKGADGHVYWILPKEAEKQWPGIEKQVRAALKIAPPEPAVGAVK